MKTNHRLRRTKPYLKDLSEPDRTSFHPTPPKSRLKQFIKTSEGPHNHVVNQNDSATRFEKCAISVSMPENSEVGTLVTTLKVLNRKKWTIIDMVDPDGTFEIRQKTGEVIIRDNRIMDRELFTNLELVAEIHGSSHMTKCARTRVNVELLDQNDNRPTFEKEKYVVLPMSLLGTISEAWGIFVPTAPATKVNH
ncbi:hypothetical protein COOONC_20494 [Cooperia oncophora]